MPGTPDVTISYTHDPQGKLLAERVVRLLEANGVSPKWDRQLQNPTSLPQWMGSVLEHSVIICVLSPEYVEYFCCDGAPEHRGVQFEARLIGQRLYGYNHSDRCPVILVATPDFSIDDLPFLLKPLRVTRLAENSDAGANELLARVRDAARSSSANARSAKPRLTAPKESHSLDVVLETVSPTAPVAHDLVRRWCKSLGEDELATPWAFPAAESIIKAVGDVELMRHAAERCLELVEPDEDGQRLRAEILISGRTWYLRAQNEHNLAAWSAREGVDLAGSLGDEALAARGKRALAKIHRRLAERAWGPCRREHLGVAAQLARESMAAFERIDPHGDEVALCRSALAKVLSVRFGSGWRRSLLRRAEAHAARAAGEIGPDPRRARYDVEILRAEIATGRRKFTEAARILDGVVAELTPRAATSGSCEELLARALLARVVLGRKANRLPSDRDLHEAQDAFTRLGLPGPVAECRWLAHASARALPAGIVRRVERWCPDPALRVRVAQAWEHERRIGGRRRLSGRDWQALVSRVRRQEEG